MDNVSSPSTTDFRACVSRVCVSQVVVVCFIAVLSLAGNTANLVILVSTPSLRNTHGYLMASLAVADLGTGLVAASAVYPTAIQVWPYGDLACQFVAFFEAIFTKASSLTLTLLSIERYIAVSHPFQYQRLVTPRNGTVSIAVICWTIPIVAYGGFVFVGANYQFIAESKVCTPAYGDRIAYTVSALMVFFLPSLLIIGLTSVSISRALSKNLRQREAMVATALASRGGNSQRPPRRAVAMFRLVRVVALAFYICWVPHVVVGIGFLIAGKPAPPNLLFFLYWLHVSTGICNFVIYFAMNTTFRQTAIQKASACQCRGNRLRKPCSSCRMDARAESQMGKDAGIATISQSGCELTGIRKWSLSYL